MHKKLFVIYMITIIMITQGIFFRANASGTIDNKTNYRVIIEDDADLISDAEESKLKEKMMQLTEFGNVLFKTTKTVTNLKSLKYIQNYYYSILNNQPGVAFYIDMKEREVCACATGGLDKIITSGKCDTIMDNVYKYAKKKDYYKSAEETFNEMNQLLKGGKIAEKMKYYCNSIVSVMISLFATFWLYSLYSKIINKKVTSKELIQESTVSLYYTPIEVIKTGSHREYSPISDSSSSSGGGFSGGGGGFSGGGGGGFSGSGGSHGF